MKRRTFALGAGSCAAGLALDVGIPGSWMRALATEIQNRPSGDGRILVVVQLSGGNDGLNTLVPYRNELYQKARPKLKISGDDVVRINDEFGLHPSLTSIESLLEGNRLAIVQGVGYPSPNRSHFESMDIWHTCATKEARKGSGWLGRYLGSHQEAKGSDASALHIGHEVLPLALVEKGVQVPSIASVEQMRLKGGDPSSSEMRRSEDEQDSNELLNFVAASTDAALAASKRLETALATPDQSGDFPATGLGERLKTISRLILAGLSTRIYYVTLDGFDTHANQPDAHAGLLRQWSEAISAFCQSMQRAGQQDRVLVMTFSEFGRRVAENASLGTDHGAAAPMIFAGPSFAKPIVGELPSLDDLDDGDLKFHTDFRDVYATIVAEWMSGNPEKVLGESFTRNQKQIPLFST